MRLSTFAGHTPTDPARGQTAKPQPGPEQSTRGQRRHSAHVAGAIILLAALMGTAAPSHAQGWIEPLPGRMDPGVVKVRTSVVVRVTDRVAQVEVEEWFRNDGSARFGEGDYIYPLPGEAVFGNFSLFQGDEEMRGETMDAAKARAIYEEIVRRKKDPALIELVGHGMVRARVFPIGAGETRKITMRYTQMLERAGDALQFRYAAGGRYAGTRGPGRERAQGPQSVREAAPLTFMLTAENGSLYRDPFSPTHDVRVTRERGRMTVRPANPLDGDFALFLPLAERPVGLSLVTHRPSGEDGWFMLTLSPGEAGLSRVARDVTAVVDVSGSMSGSKIEQAKNALRQLLGTLDRNDRFRLIRFSSGVSTYRNEWTTAAPADIRSALEWVDDLRAEGGTNISGALEEAFRASSPDSRLPVVVFVTDGLPSAGITEPERIADLAQREGGRSRVFAFGVGYDVNTYLLDRLGSAGRGSTEYVQPGEDVEIALGSLSAKIRHPVLADLELAGSSVRIDEVYPRRLPDLFAGEDLVILGRYRGASRDIDAELEIQGQRSGRAERYAVRAVFPSHQTGNDYLPRLWASRKIGALQQEVRLNGADPELVEEIRATALRFGLLSEYTSYLVQEPDAVLLRAGMPSAPVPASADATGQAAVQRAEESRKSREAKTLADVRQAQNAVAERAVSGAGRDDSGSRRMVAGRVFVDREGVWTDTGDRSKLRTVSVEPFSGAYFALLKRLPELEPYWQEFDRVMVTGRAIAIGLGEKGVTQLSTAELDRLVLEFRSR